MNNCKDKTRLNEFGSMTARKCDIEPHYDTQWVGSAISRDLGKNFTFQIKLRFALFEVSSVIKGQKRPWDHF